MHLETLPTCHDFEKRFDLFLDGELDGRTMRSLAMHVTRCEVCEGELRRSENLQDAIGETIGSVVDQIDAAGLWHDVADHVESSSPTALERVRARWQRGDSTRTIVRLTALAAGFALLLLATDSLIPARNPLPEPLVSNKADIDRLTSSAAAVAVWTEPDQQTTAIWVASFEP